MIYTVTLNPSIDYIVQLEDLQLGQLNRIEKEYKFPGGKGINVSRILNRLGQDTTCLGFLGGFTGHFIQQQLAAEGLEQAFTMIEEDTRINIKLRSQVETEINGQGPHLTSANLLELEQQLKRVTKDDLVIFSGSLPPTLPQDFYQHLIKLVDANGARFVIDTTGDSLLKALPYKPLLIKPNHHELAELFSQSELSFSQMINYAQQLQTKGAQNVLVSMGGNGALLITETAVYQSNVLDGQLQNSVGAGDSMIAGFMSQLAIAPDNVIDAFKYGVAAGSATAFTTDLATKADILALVPYVELTLLNDEKGC